MFLVRLGRKRVAILHKGSLELPSDISGLIYIRFNKRVDEVKLIFDSWGWGAARKLLILLVGGADFSNM